MSNCGEVSVLERYGGVEGIWFEELGGVSLGAFGWRTCSSGYKGKGPQHILVGLDSTASDGRKTGRNAFCAVEDNYVREGIFVPLGGRILLIYLEFRDVPRCVGVSSFVCSRVWSSEGTLLLPTA